MVGVRSGPPPGGTIWSSAPTMMNAGTGARGGGSSPNTAPTTGAIAASFVDNSRPRRCAIMAPFDMPVT